MALRCQCHGAWHACRRQSSIPSTGEPISLRASERAGRSIVAMLVVAVGMSRSRLNGGNLISDAADREWPGLGAVAAQFLDDAIAVVRSKIVREARKSLGQNVVMVYVFQTRFAGDIQPQAMKQDDVL